MLENYFLNPNGLKYLLFLIPLLILYFIKPKPIKKKVPSLIFFLSASGKNKLTSFFRTLVTDWLFLFQFFIVLFLSLSVAQPTIFLPQNILVKNNIIIVDVSASVKPYFNKIIDSALDNLGSKNTIILIKKNPVVALEDAGSFRTKQFLKSLKPTDEPSNIADALSLANNYASSETSVIIISDFLPSKGSFNIAPLIKAIEAKGSLVKKIIFDPVKEGVTNKYGIVDLLVKSDTSKVWLKNYQNKPDIITLMINDVEKKISLEKKETKEIIFDTPPGMTRLLIKEKDDFLTDNEAFISTPSKNDIKILVITNDKDSFLKSNFKLALSLIDKNYPINFHFDYAIPPRFPNFNHDLYIIYKVNPDFILPGVINKLNKKVSDGAGLIIFAQDKLFSVSWKNLLKASFVDEGLSAVLEPDDNYLTKDINFGQVKKYFIIKTKKEVNKLVSIGENPIITIHKNNNGLVLYYGLLEGYESFSYDNTYPVFWRRIINLLTNRPTIESLNQKTGSILFFPKEESIKSPRGLLKTKTLILEDAGFYILNDRVIAASLLNDREGYFFKTDLESDKNNNNLEKISKKVKTEITFYLLLFVLILLFLELLFLKYRGDL